MTVRRRRPPAKGGPQAQPRLANGTMTGLRLRHGGGAGIGFIHDPVDWQDPNSDAT